MQPIHDEIKKTWLRHFVIYMCHKKKFRMKWFLKLFRNYPLIILYKDGVVIKKYTLKSLGVV